MVLNQSADYALRAVLYIAGGSHEAQSTEMVATAIGVPRNYLGKVLHTLVRARVLRSTRGPRGGFQLAAAPGEIVIATVVAPFHEMPSRRSCLLGDRVCDAATPCAAHERWRSMTDPVNAFLQQTTIEQMLGETP
jgi:Rrf2 family protein